MYLISNVDGHNYKPELCKTSVLRHHPCNCGTFVEFSPSTGISSQRLMTLWSTARAGDQIYLFKASIETCQTQ